MICCTFAGHRTILHAGIEREVRRHLEMLMEKDEEFCFYTGGMGEFDRLCEKAVRNLKKQRQDKHIRLVLVEPYMKSGLNTRGEQLLSLYDEIIIPEESRTAHYKRAITLRNRWMVDHSQCLISYVFRDHGGAYEMLSYARRQSRRILMVCPDEEPLPFG